MSTLAALMCNHSKRAQDGPCGRCSGEAIRKVNALGEDLVVQTAKALVRIEGYDCAPTSLTYLSAVKLLSELLPIIRQADAA